MYGITSECVEELREAQGNLCAICREPLANGQFCHVDHDHTSGRVRGVLCNRCNTGLGKFLDDAGLLRKAAHYLETASAYTSCSGAVSD
jgi:hypothetical protein